LASRDIFRIFTLLMQLSITIKIKVMFRLNEVLGFLKNELNYTHSQLLDFCNVIDGVCKGDDVMVKGSDIEVILGIADMRKLECEVVQSIDLIRSL